MQKKPNAFKHAQMKNFMVSMSDIQREYGFKKARNIQIS